MTNVLFGGKDLYTCVLCESREIGVDINQGKLVLMTFRNLKGWFPVCQPCMNANDL
jgi:hypothetical protein